jgi:hypothetical protein
MPPMLMPQLQTKTPTTWFLIGYVQFRWQLPLVRVSAQRASASMLPAAAAEAEASMTEWGISLGSWKAPQTKTPSRLVFTGVRQSVWRVVVWFRSTPSRRARRYGVGLGASPTERTTMSNWFLPCYCPSSVA